MRYRYERNKDMMRVKQISKHVSTCVLGIALFFGAHQGSAATPQVKPSCIFNISILPTIAEKVKAAYPDASGSVGNVFLADGREIVLPKGLGLSVTPGQNLTVKGLISSKKDIVSASAVSVEDVWVCATGSSPSLALPPAQQSEGHVARLLHSGEGNVEGVVLDNGVTIRLPRSFQGRSALHVGDLLSASGRGFIAQSGPLIIADKIGERGTILYQIESESSVPKGPPPGSTGYDRIENNLINFPLP